MLSRSTDNSIRVLDAETGTLDTSLIGHESVVLGLAVRGDRLFSASADGTIRVWALGTWAALQTVEASARGTKQYPVCLTVSGSQLVSGSAGYDSLPQEVRVWGLETLELQHTLPQHAGEDVRALLATKGEVWAGVDNDVVVWGRGA